jgi:hypothetical protein
MKKENPAVEHDWDLPSWLREPEEECPIPASSGTVGPHVGNPWQQVVPEAVATSLKEQWLRGVGVVYDRLEKERSEEVTETISREEFSLLVSDEYELIRSVPVQVHRCDDGTVVLSSPELNLYAQGDTEYSARREFSDVLVEELEDLETEGMENLGRALQISLSMLRRLLRKIG